MIIHASYRVLMDVCALMVLLSAFEVALSAKSGLSNKAKLSIGVLLDVRSVQLRPLLETKMGETKEGSSLLFQPHISTVDITDSFAVSNAMCDLITKDVVAIIGVTNASSLSTIQSYSNTFNMPFVSIGSTQNFTTTPGFQLFVRPSFMGAVVDLLHHYGCRKAVYIYDSDEGLMRIQDLFQSLNTRDLLIDLDVRRINSLPVAKDSMGAPAGVDHMTKGDTNQKVFYIMDLEQLDVLGVIRYLKKEHVLSGIDLNIIAVALDLVPVSSSNTDLSATNISGFQLVSDGSADQVIGLHDSIFTDVMKSTEALLVDAVDVVRTAVEEVERVSPGWLVERSKQLDNQVKCTNFVVDKTTHGQILMEHLRQVQFEGQTGRVTFDENGKRNNFALEIFESTSGEANKRVGKWHPEHGLRMSSSWHIEKTVILLINNTRPVHFVQKSE
ncbi:glutamate receptor-like [Haliotis cracherodii]|uniref:glutamate receptor-like n=1 Tax=Haliotis cracherodii TaxID=6455 RepID=UPI0039ED66DC